MAIAWFAVAESIAIEPPAQKKNVPMCLGIPGRIVDTYHEHDMLMGKVDFGGVSKQICLSLTPDVQVGQYVIVHVGFALQVIDEEEAEKVFEFLRYMDDLEELHVSDADLPSEPDSRRKPVS